MRYLDVVLLLCLAAPGCTVCKPIVCAVTAPVLMLGESGPGLFHFHHGSSHGLEALAMVFGVASVVGIVSGFATGMASDFNVLTGRVDEHHAARNITNPFQTNEW